MTKTLGGTNTIRGNKDKAMDFTMSANASQSGPAYYLNSGNMTAGCINISDEEFQLLRDLIYERFGINLTQQKRALLVGRLGKLLRKLGLCSFKAYYEYLLSDTSGRALDTLVNHISTNFTFFYREKDHFDFFTLTALPELTERLEREKSRDIRVWCAGCASGEEPYLLAMLLLEYFGDKYELWKAGVLATDVSARALAEARQGIYPEKAMDKLPRYLRERYFKKQQDGNYEIIERIKKEVTFRRFNLMNEVFPFRKPFHIIFCRNVMIYFDSETRTKLIQKFYHSMVPSGYFFIGHSETLGRNQPFFEYVRPAIYKRK